MASSWYQGAYVFKYSGTTCLIYLAYFAYRLVCIVKVLRFFPIHSSQQDSIPINSTSRSEQFSVQMLPMKNHILGQAYLLLIYRCRWMEEHAFKWGSNVEFINTTDKTTVLGLAGPKSRDVLVKLTSIDLSDKAFPFMTCQNGTVAGIPIKAIRISYSGEFKKKYFAFNKTVEL